MPLDTRGFVAPESNFQGLYKLSDTLDKKRYREQADAERKQGQQMADTKFISNYFDPKEKLTGSPLDPQSQKLLDKAYRQALDLNRQGANLAQVMGSTAPMVAQLNEYMVKGKAYNEQKKIALQEAAKIKGIDANKLAAQMDAMAFPVDPNTGDVDPSKYDPNQNYADLALRQGDVFNNQGFDEFIKGAKLNTTVGQAKSINSKGGYVKHKAEISAPNFYVSEVDADGNHTGFAPAYEIATDENGMQYHEFQKEDGTKEKAPVRLLDKKVFNDLPPDAKGYVLQEARRYAKEHGMELNSVQAENLARAIAYDELNSKSKKYGTVKNIEETKANPIKNITNVSVGGSKGSGSEVIVNDIYKGIEEQIDSDTKGGFNVTRLNALDSDAQSLIIDFARKLKGDDEIGNSNVFLHKNKDGNVVMYYTEGGELKLDKEHLIGILPRKGTNLKVQPGVKEKREVVKQEAKKQVKFSDLDPNGFKKEGKYWKYKDGTLFDDKGNVVNK